MEQTKDLPQGIEELCMEVEELKSVIRRDSEKSMVFRNEDIPNYLNCSNPICHGGGMVVSGIVENMIQQKKEYYELAEKCTGYEGSPKGRRRYQSCVHGFAIKIRIKYSNL